MALVIFKSMPGGAERAARIANRYNNGRAPTPYQIQQYINSQRDEHGRKELDHLFESMCPEELAEHIGLDQVGFISEIFYNHGNPRIPRTAKNVDRFIKVFDSLTDEFSHEQIFSVFDLREDIDNKGSLKTSRIKRELHKRRR